MRITHAEGAAIQALIESDGWKLLDAAINTELEKRRLSLEATSVGHDQTQVLRGMILEARGILALPVQLIEMAEPDEDDEPAKRKDILDFHK